MHTIRPTILSSPHNFAKADFRQGMALHLSSFSSLSSLPCDLHGLVYSYLEWNEKMIFISFSKEISSLSRSYREMKLKKTFSLEYALNESFRESVCSLVLPCHVELDLSWCHDYGYDTDPSRQCSIYLTVSRSPMQVFVILGTYNL
jgi:hypothetical protein